MAVATGRDATEPDIASAAAGAEGSVAQALALLDPKTQAMRHNVTALLDRLPHTDAIALHALGESLAGTDSRPLAAFVDLVNRWLSEQIKAPAEVGRLARFAEAWEKVNAAARDADIYNLDRKPLVFAVFGLLADAARG